MERIYLVDLENVGRQFLEGSKNLTQEDVVVLYRSGERGRKLEESILFQLEQTKATVRRVRMDSHTKNAMDFQICTYLGYLIGCNGTGARYYIVSNDKGYIAAIEFVERTLKENVKVCMVSNFKEVTDKDDLKKELKEKLNEYHKKVVAQASVGFEMSENLNDYHNYLQEHIKKDSASVFAKTKELFMKTKNINMGDEK